jgi:hypothetical protein
MEQEQFMPFVFERLNTPERQAEFRDLKVISPLTRKLADPELMSGWVVDRERGWYFMCLGGGAAEMPYFFVLADKDGAVLNAHGRVKHLKGPSAGTVDITWTIELLNVDELTELLREALMVLAPARVPEKVTGVRIEFGTSRGI